MSHAGAGGEIVKYYNHRFPLTLSRIERLLALGAGPDSILSIIKQTATQHLRSLLDT